VAKKSICAVTRGEVDLDAYEAKDGEWRALGLAAPARRALINAGLTKLTQLKTKKRGWVAELHGMGPNALNKLDEAMTAQGIQFRSER
jgi:hypothetical protein